MNRTIIFTVCMLFLVSVFVQAPAKTKFKSVVIKGKFMQTVKVTGYLTDVFCGSRQKSLDLTDMNTHPERHSVRCTLMSPCVASGYGLMIDAGGAGVKNFILKYRFDKKGNETALKYLKTTRRKDNLLVTVTGKDDKGILIDIIIKDAK